MEKCYSLISCYLSVDTTCPALTLVICAGNKNALTLLSLWAPVFAVSILVPSESRVNSTFSGSWFLFQGSVLISTLSHTCYLDLYHGYSHMVHNSLCPGWWSNGCSISLGGGNHLIACNSFVRSCSCRDLLHWLHPCIHCGIIMVFIFLLLCVICVDTVTWHAPKKIWEFSRGFCEKSCFLWSQKVRILQLTNIAPDLSFVLFMLYWRVLLAFSGFPQTDSMHRLNMLPFLTSVKI